MELSKLYLIGLGLIITCVIIEIFICFVTIYQLYIKQPSIWINPHYKYLTVMAMISYTSCNIGDIIQLTIRYLHFPNRNHLDPYENHINCMNDILYYLGNIAFFILLLLRIRTSFEIISRVMCFLFILFGLSVLFDMLYCIVMFYWIRNPSTSILGQKHILYPIVLCLLIIDFSLNCTLFLLFIYKIRNRNSMEGIENDMSIKFNRESMNQRFNYNYDKMKIWNIMIKHCVLFGIALIVNQIFYISICAATVRLTDDNFPSTLIQTHIVREVENLCNVIILWLVLRINNVKYVYLCKCWHILILKYCLKKNHNMIHESLSNDNYGCIAGHDLIVTNRNDEFDDIKNKNDVEGHQLLLTEEM